MPTTTTHRSALETDLGLRDGVRLVLIRPEWAVLTDYDAPASMLLAIIAYWQERSRKSGGWVFRTQMQLSDDACGLLSVGMVASATKRLVSAGLIETRSNPDAKYDKTRQYRLATQQIEATLKDPSIDERLARFSIPLQGDVEGRPVEVSKPESRPYRALSATGSYTEKTKRTAEDSSSQRQEEIGSESAEAKVDLRKQQLERFKRFRNAFE